jgi:cysteine-rich repeat protein
MRRWAGNGNDAACKLDCTLNVCGDGHVGPGEACDAATTATSTAVPPRASCRPAAAGSCKPARRATSAKATTTLVCLQADCGDGFVQAGEQGDDSNGGQTDACLATCESAACGDGFVWAGHEQCDDGNLVGGDGSTTGYARLDGVIVANDWADLLDDSLDATISFTEIGTFAPLGV